MKWAFLRSGNPLDAAGRMEIIHDNAYAWALAGGPHDDALNDRLKTIKSYNKKPMYQITANEFICILYEMLSVWSGVTQPRCEFPLEKLNDMVDDIYLMEETALWWIHHECNSSKDAPTAFGKNIDFLWLNEDKTGLNARFVVFAYHVIKLCRNKTRDMQAWLTRQNLNIAQIEPKSSQTQPLYKDKEDFVKFAISTIYDLNEFICEVKIHIQNRTTNKDHECIAMLSTDSSTIRKGVMDPDGVFRLIFGSHFDGHDANFNAFFHNFPNACTIYLMQDYLHDSSLESKMCPMLKVFIGDTPSRFVSDFVDPDNFRDRAMELYGPNAAMALSVIAQNNVTQ